MRISPSVHGLAVAVALCTILTWTVSLVEGQETAPPINRIEAAATPRPFASLTVQRAQGSHLTGDFVLDVDSDGLDLAHDRVVVAAGTRVAVIEPGMFECSPRDRVCRFVDDGHALVRRLQIVEAPGRRWQFNLTPGPDWAREATFNLRIGNDISARLQPQLDDLRRAQATIGAAGGAVETVDADGAVIRLDVPPGALAEATVISVTPLTTSPLPGNAAAHPGVKLEPEGQQFLTPVTLTFDFGHQVPPETRLFLVTSPLTKLPLGGELTGGVLRASLWHFSVPQPGSSDPTLSDLDWAAGVLQSPTPLTVQEMHTLLAIVADQQLGGCAADCLDVAAVTAKIQDSVAVIVASECASPTITASKLAIRRLVSFELILQQVGGSLPAIQQCAHTMLGVLINRLVGPPQSTAPDDPYLVEAKDLGDTAKSLNMIDRSVEAYGKLADGVRQLVALSVTTAQSAWGTPEESGVIQQSRSLILQGRTWVTTLAPEILAVDAPLAQFILDALDRLEPGGMTVGLQDGHISCPRPEEGPPIRLPIPHLVSAGRNTLEWSLDIGMPCASGFLTAELSFSRAGTLTFTADPGWLPPPIFNPGNIIPTFNAGYLWVVGTGQQFMCHRSSSWYGCAFDTAPETTALVEAGPLTITMNAGYYDPVNAATRASGRALTIRFTPRP